MRALALLALSVFLLTPEAHAQLGGLVDRAKRAAQSAVQEREPERRPAVTPATRATAAPALDIASGADDPLAPTGPMPVSSAGFAPGMDALPWMKNLAGLSMNPVQGTALTPQIWRLAPSNLLFPAPEATYQFILRRASGEVVMWQELTMDVDPNLSAFGTLKVNNTPANRERAAGVTLAAGTYRAILTANGHEIGTIPFDVQVKGSTDPFDNRSEMWTDGSWTHTAALRISAEDGSLGMSHWLNSQAASGDGAKIEVAVFRGSERLTEARGSEQRLYTENYFWKHNDVGFHKDRGTLKLSDLSDGDYRIEAFEPGETPLQTFRFRVEDGAIVPAPESALDYAPRSDFLSPRSATVITREGPSTLVWLRAE